jgi:hypothetical protein
MAIQSPFVHILPLDATSLQNCTGQQLVADAHHRGQVVVGRQICLDHFAEIIFETHV